MEQTREVILANEIAQSLNDPNAVDTLLPLTTKYHEGYLRNKLKKTLETPDGKIINNQTIHFMQLVNSGDEKKVTVWEYVRPALGYFSVAFVCLFSGNSLRNGGSFKDILSIGLEQFLYLIFLMPVFVTRVIMYEKIEEVDPKFVDIEWIKISKQVPRIFIFLALFIFLVTCIIFWQSGSTLTINWHKLLCAGIAVLPILIQTEVSRKVWRNNMIHDFDFRYYIFFPALSTCIMSYMVGWTQLESYFFILIPSGVITLYYVLSLKTKTLEKTNWKYVDYCFLILFSVFFLIGYIGVIPTKNISFTEINMASGYLVLLASCMMTLMMGLTETWWLVKDKNNFRKLIFGNRLAFYNKRVNQFSIFLPIAMTLMIFDQHVNIWFYFIIMYSLAISGIWLILQHIKYKRGFLIENKGWRGIRLFFGMILPVFFSFSLSPNFSSFHSSIMDKQLQNIGPYLAFAFTLCINITGGLRKETLTKEKKICIGIVSAIVIFLGVTNTLFDLHFQSITIMKLNILQAYCFGAGMIFIFGKFESETKEDKQINDDSNNGSMNTQKANLVKTLFFFIQSGRPLPSFLSGMYGFFLFYQTNNNISFSFLKIVPIILVTMLAFVYNDIFDVEKDRLAGKNRPITTGKLSISRAKLCSWVTAIIALLYEIEVNNFQSFCVILLTLLGAYFYSSFSKNLPFFKVLYTAVICCAPLIYGDVVFGIEIEFVKLVPVLIFIIGREIWLDKIDLNSDFEFNLKTIPYYLGRRATIPVAFSLMTIGVLMIFFISTNGNSLGLSITAISVLLVCFMLYKKYERISVFLSRFSILFGIAALAYSL